MGLIDEMNVKRIRIEEKIRGNFYLFAYGVNDLSHLVPRRKVCFGELFDGLSCAALDILIDILYFLSRKLGRDW